GQLELLPIHRTWLWGTRPDVVTLAGAPIAPRATDFNVKGVDDAATEPSGKMVELKYPSEVLQCRQADPVMILFRPSDGASIRGFHPCAARRQINYLWPWACCCCRAAGGRMSQWMPMSPQR